MSEETRFENFVQAVEEFDLGDKDVKATAHTSAVSIRWDRVAELADEKEETKEEN
jgi:hypothetical protein